MIRILNEQEIRDLVALDASTVAAIETGFAELARGNALVPPIMMIPVPERHGEVDIKSAYIKGLDRMAVKVASGFFACCFWLVEVLGACSVLVLMTKSSRQWEVLVLAPRLRDSTSLRCPVPRIQHARKRCPQILGSLHPQILLVLPSCQRPLLAMVCIPEGYVVP